MIRFLFVVSIFLAHTIEFVYAQEVSANSSVKKEESIEIQVIRPRFFSKKDRLEIGLSGVFIANQSFIYTYLMSAIVDYHLNEYVGLELSYDYGASSEKQEKHILTSDFEIKTEIDRVQSMALAGVTLTPIYGKYQLGGGRLLYFDTFFTFGGGGTGVNYLYDHCSGDSAPSSRVVWYPTVFAGVGQRYFVGENGSIRYDIRSHFFNKNEADASCTPSTAASSSVSTQIVTLQIGYSYYF